MTQLLLLQLLLLLLLLLLLGVWSLEQPTERCCGEEEAVVAATWLVESFFVRIRPFGFCMALASIACHDSFFLLFACFFTTEVLIPYSPQFHRMLIELSFKKI